MIERTSRIRAHPAAGLVSTAVAVLALATAVVLSRPVGAASHPISGTASVAIGFGGSTIGVPQTSTFTGTLDSATGAIVANVASTPLSMSLPIGGSNYAITGTFSNPGGFAGQVSGSSVSLSGTARFTLTGFTIPGVSVPPVLGLLGCNLDFVPHFTGTYDPAAGTIRVSDSSITVPTFPPLCARALNAALGTLVPGIDINTLLAALPGATATMALRFAQPLVTTTTTASTIAPTTTVGVSTTTPPGTTPTTTTASSTTTLPQTRSGLTVAPVATSVASTPTYVG